MKRIGVIAGYNVLADKNEVHRKFVTASFYRCSREEVEVIFLVGGATNSDYPELTEAEASAKIIRELYEKYCTPQIELIVLGVGNTSADTLKAVKDSLKAKQIIPSKIVFCVEMSRTSGFDLDGLYVGLNELAQNYLVVVGFRFPETSREFANQKKKMLGKVLSHRYPFFHWLRYLYQKRHQRRVAKLVREKGQEINYK